MTLPRRAATDDGASPRGGGEGSVVARRIPYNPALDGIRAVAIALVLGIHAPTKPLLTGYVGVTLFFSLSGYLITSLLLAELGASGRIDYRHFYRKRFARLGPALIAVVVMTDVLLIVASSSISVWAVLSATAAVMTYTYNLFVAFGHQFGTGEYLNYTWSLSIEEQFYAIWPLLIAGVYPRSPRKFTIALGMTVLAVGAFDCWLGLTAAAPYQAHPSTGTDVHSLPILAGALLAITSIQGVWTARVSLVGRLAPGGLVGLLVLSYQDTGFHIGLAVVLATIAAVTLIVSATHTPQAPLSRVLASKAFTWLGKRAYSIYLWNILIRLLLLKLQPPSVALDVLWLLLTLAAAEISFKAIEQPLRLRFSTPGRQTGRS